jgi:signal transduction histidine kinase
VAVARNTGEIDRAIALLRRLLAVAGVSVLAMSGAATIIVMRRGFRPVRALAAKLAGMDARRLGEPISVDGVPDELTVLVAKLNELLSRLEAAFGRERQFTSDASHELRTPMAALRSIIEVSLSRERNHDEYRASLREALAVVVQASELVEQLLMLARADGGEIPLCREPVSLRELAVGAFVPLATAAKERRLSFENQIPESAVVTSDREKLRVVVANLLGNAVQYATEGGVVSARSAPEEGLVLEVRNTGPALPESERERIFERFVRLDGSRTAAAEHAGVGLALVRSLCGSLGFAVSAHNDPESWVAFRVRSTQVATAEEKAS